MPAAVSAVETPAPAGDVEPCLWSAFVRAFAILLPAIAASLLVKFAMLQRGGMGAAARAMGRTGLGATEGTLYPIFFTPWETLSFYRNDLLVALIVVPAIATALIRRRPERVQLTMLAVISLLLTVFFYTQLQLYMSVGGFLSLDLLVETFRWGAGHPEDVQTYIGPHVEILFLLACIVAGIVFLTASPAFKTPWRWARPRGQRWTAGLLACAVAGLTTGSWLPDLPTTAMHRSVYSMTMVPLVPVLESQTGPYDNLTLAELRTGYETLTGAKPHQKDLNFWGSARGYNVLFFILETTPARVLDFDGDISDLPHMSRLREQAWLGRKHLTTSAMSNRSAFSLVSSIYPSAKEEIVPGPRLRLPGIVQTLKGEGYEAGLYLPATLVLDWEEWMFQALGFERIFVGDQTVKGLPEDRDWQTKKMLDRVALDAMKDDIARWADADRPFVAAYLPQLGHAPWPDILEDGVDQDLEARGRAILQLNDKWMGELLALLEDKGSLERTLIVVTGDHGIRNVNEDPEFTAGRLTDRSVRVPLLLYAPGTIESARGIDWVTSHIDVTPTLLNLLGSEAGRELEQGAPVWDRRLQERSAYFWAHMIEGVGGYYQGGTYYLRNDIIDAVYADTEFQFQNNDQVAKTAPAFSQVLDHMRRIEHMQRAWLQQALQ